MRTYRTTVSLPETLRDRLSGMNISRVCAEALAQAADQAECKASLRQEYDRIEAALLHARQHADGRDEALRLTSAVQLLRLSRDWTQRAGIKT